MSVAFACLWAAIRPAREAEPFVFGASAMLLGAVVLYAVQSLSWTMFEAVTWDSTRITSRDWSSYPIARFPDVPGSVDVEVIERPGAPFLGTGEAAQGPTAAALANALAHATGARIRELPLSRTRVKAAIGV